LLFCRCFEYWIVHDCWLANSRRWGIAWLVMESAVNHRTACFRKSGAMEVKTVVPWSLLFWSKTSCFVVASCGREGDVELLVQGMSLAARRLLIYDITQATSSSSSECLSIYSPSDLLGTTRKSTNSYHLIN
jgi:hypothetical protein